MQFLIWFGFFLLQDIGQNIQCELRPNVTNIPASSIYSVRSGPAKRTVSAVDSPLATSSNASLEPSARNQSSCLDESEIDSPLATSGNASLKPTARNQSACCLDESEIEDITVLEAREEIPLMVSDPK